MASGLTLARFVFLCLLFLAGGAKTRIAARAHAEPGLPRLKNKSSLKIRLGWLSWRREAVLILFGLGGCKTVRSAKPGLLVSSILYIGKKKTQVSGVSIFQSKKPNEIQIGLNFPTRRKDNIQVSGVSTFQS